MCLDVLVGQTQRVGRTLDDGQEDDDDEEEKRDVKDDALDLELVSGRVLDLVPDASTRTHPHIHVEHVALEEDVVSFIVSYIEEGHKFCFSKCQRKICMWNTKEFP